MARPSAPDDDAALRWDYLDDSSYLDPGAADAEPNDAAVGDVVSASDRGAVMDAQDAPATPEQPAPGLRLLTAAFAVVFVLWSVGWIISVGLVPISGPTLLIEVLYQFSEFLAIVASALWFAAVVALTPQHRLAPRLGWLTLGTLVLLPWPLVLGVAA
ncbi:MAG: hypothetical protein RL499_165 [Actinomycetota bacterium]|jgi:hypothetical protein